MHMPVYKIGRFIFVQQGAEHLEPPVGQVLSIIELIVRKKTGLLQGRAEITCAFLTAISSGASVRLLLCSLTQVIYYHMVY